MRSNIIDFIGGGGGGSYIEPPAHLAKNVNSALDTAMPTPENDGGFIAAPISGTQKYTKYNAAGAILWEVGHLDINAACNTFTGCRWLDTVDGALWVWAYDTATAPDTYYLGKIDLSTGAVTQIGACQPGDGKFSGSMTTYHSTRSSMGSGNFTVRDGEQEIVISSVDGSIISGPTVITQNGNSLGSSCSYQTADGTTYLYAGPVQDANGVVLIGLWRGGFGQKYNIPENSPAMTTVSTFFLWGDCVVLLGSGVRKNGTFYERSVLDSWLKEIADYYGMPE